MNARRALRLGAWLTAALWAAPARAQFNNTYAGTSGAQFLEIGPGARPVAMGQAFAGLADDINALYYNPAGIALLKDVQIGGMHDQYFQDLDYNFGALTLPVARLSRGAADPEDLSYGVLGFAVYSLGASDLQARGLSDTDQPTGTFGVVDTAYALSYARGLGGGFYVGATAKAVTQQIASYDANSFAADAGALYVLGDLRAAVGFRNLGTGAEFQQTSDPMPFSLYAGGSYKLFDRLALDVDVDAPRDNNPQVSVGGEYTQPISRGLSAALRAGYYTENTDPSGLTGVSLGAGVAVRNISFDFAWVPFGDLGNTFLYSILLKF